MLNCDLTVDIGSIWAKWTGDGFNELWFFADSDQGVDSVICVAKVVVTAKLNEIDGQAWLLRMLWRMPTTHIEELLPQSWKDQRATLVLAP
ncbi:transposase domain-containing protein [Rhizobium sp. L80/93]|uniref:hypothetical protein n=1 Tax=Rhizobium sp. E27B/91 TaxID=2819995 RepID=UPI000DAA96AE|nr:hypothetical protein [Rhizobium sp. E27B/91]QYA05208.1 transposase domain-containing protein [Rhizobium sp. B21/90]